VTTAFEDLDVLDACSLTHRLARARVRVDGDVFDPLAIPYMVELYDEPWRSVVVQKGAQLGVTVWAVLSVIERMRTGIYPRGVLYGFPTQEEVYDFAQARFEKILRDNAAFFAGAVRSTDRTELKEIGTGMLYFRGVKVVDKSKRPSKLLSVPVDCLVLDEHDDMDPFAIEIVQSRLDSSLLRHQIVLGHPSYPRYGIARKYDESDQRRWLIKCEGCNAYTCMEDDFPHCVGTKDDANWFRCCRKCKRELFTITGEWVPRHPGRDVRGYLISQLLSTRKPVNVIVEAYHKIGIAAGNESAFWNLVMARPHATLDDSLDEAHVKSLFNADKPQELAHAGPSFLGADVGKTTLHVTIGSLSSADRGHVHWIGELKTFDELYDLGKKHNVQTGVIDAMAESRSVKDFTDRAPWAYGCHYVEGLPVGDYRWDGPGRVVKVGRTSSIDMSHRAIVQRRLTFRRADEYTDNVFVPQLLNLVRVRIQNQKTGDERAFWHVLDGSTKNDHYRHAVNYAWIASTATAIVRQDPRERWPSDDDGPRSWQTA
jgi:hypothetical protein